MEKKKWLTTDNPAIVFEDNSVGRMKKEVWDMTEEQLDEVLKEYEVPSPSELGIAGTYIQNTPRYNQIEKRRKNDLVFVPDVPKIMAYMQTRVLIPLCVNPSSRPSEDILKSRAENATSHSLL